jgi:hypothetical protein
MFVKSYLHYFNIYLFLLNNALHCYLNNVRIRYSDFARVN